MELDRWRKRGDGQLSAVEAISIRRTCGVIELDDQ